MIADLSAISLRFRSRPAAFGSARRHHRLFTATARFPEGEHTVIGHLHPALGVTDHAGASHRMPVFVRGPKLTLMPAFSPLAAGVDIRETLAVRPRQARVIVASGKASSGLGRVGTLKALAEWTLKCARKQSGHPRAP